MATGTVKWFDDSKGFGFIERDDGEDVFVHHSEIERPGYKTLFEGYEVQFETEQTDDGLAAVTVEPLDEPDHTPFTP